VVTIRESGSKNRSSNISNNLSNVNLTNALANLGTNLGNNSGANQVLETFEKLLLLFRNSLFRPLKTDTLAELARHAEIRVYNSGEEIYKSGDLPRAILALVNGSAEICASGGDRRQLVQNITKIAPNQTLGQLEVLTQTCFTNSAIATSPQTLILAINAELFMQAMREDALYTQHLLISVSSNLQSVLSQMITK
jgi:CRP-like cAMP-binding protein